MDGMFAVLFAVRSARTLRPPPALSRALPVHAVCVAATQRPHVSRALPLLASHARLSTRQGASAFNQPLSFNTSKVTSMQFMFEVRSARALCPPSLESGHPRARRLHYHHPTRPLNPHRACPPFDSAGRKLLVRR